MSDIIQSESGVLFIAQGKKFVEEVKISAESVKLAMPSLLLALITDDVELLPKSKLFDIILPFGSGPFTWMKRIEALIRTPFERTLYLDSDTYVCGRLDDLFRLLDRFEIALSHTTVKHSSYLHDLSSPYLMEQVPETFPELCCGVILYRRCDKVRRLFESWSREFENQWQCVDKPAHDQPSFTKAAYESDVRLATLPPEYHCWFTSGGFLSGPVCILHGRSSDFNAAAARLNSSTAHEFTGTIAGSYSSTPPPELCAI